VTEDHVGGRRWCSTGGRPRQPKEAAGSMLRRLLATDGGSVADLAWRTRAVRDGWRLVQRSAATSEQRSAVRAEQSGRCSAAVVGRGETASPTDRQHDEVTHGATAACVACGADGAAGRQRRCEVAAAASGRRLEALHMGWRLQAQHVEAERQVARVGVAAGAVGTGRSASGRHRRTVRTAAQARTCKPAI
jgi:hypothetical protein